MKISKFVQTVKSTGRCIVYHTPGEIYLGTGASIYKAPEIPNMTGDSQIAAVLDIDHKKMKKIHLEEKFCESRADICGIDLGEAPCTQIDITKMDVAAAIDGKIYETFLCHDNGEILFFDGALLAPIKDRIKDEDAYINYTVRIHPKGYKYVVVNDGYEALAAILPVKVLSDKYIKALREFYLRCDEQYKWQQATKENSIQEEVREGNE